MNPHHASPPAPSAATPLDDHPRDPCRRWRALGRIAAVFGTSRIAAVLDTSRIAAVSRTGRAAAILRIGLAAGLAANALAMTVRPDRWYHAVPGVAETGPLNLHFVRDIGAAYAAAALGLAWRAWRPAAWPAAALGASFLLMHAAVHLYELAAGICGVARFAQDMPGVGLPALLAAVLAAPPRVGTSHA